MGFPKGQKMPRHEVWCVECGAGPMLRAVYLKEPRCGPCGKKRGYVAWSRSTKLMRMAARRYRILMIALRWRDDNFDANLKLLRERMKERMAS